MNDLVECETNVDSLTPFVPGSFLEFKAFNSVQCPIDVADKERSSARAGLVRVMRHSYFSVGHTKRGTGRFVNLRIAVPSIA